MIAARIDRLSSDDRHFLRRVSVLGRSAPLDLLGAVLEEIPASDDPIWTRLREFAAPDGAGNLVFRHALLRDSAYDGLSYKVRRALHGSVGKAIRLASGENPDENAALLSLHYLHAQSYPEAWEYSLVAAWRAWAVYANIEAAEFFERALVAARRLPELTAAQVAEVHEALGDARDRSGGYVRALSHFRAARRLVHDDALADARLMLKMARVQGWLDRYSNALRWITKALRLLEGTEQLEARRQRAHLLAWYGRFCQEQGHYGRAISWCEQAVAEAERADEKEALANALAVLDWAHQDLGTLEHPANWERALALMEDLGDLQGQGRILNDLGTFAYFRGRWKDAIDLYGQAQGMARRAGHAVQLAMYENNMAEIALDQGRIDEAERLFQSVVRTCRAAGHRSGEAYVQGNLARAAARLGRYDEAIALFRESRREADALGSQADSIEVGSRWAECELLAGKVEEALARSETEVIRARAVGGVVPQLPLLHRVRGVALVRSGDRESAAEALRQSLEAARARKVDYEAALTMGVMAALGLTFDERTPSELGDESAHIFDALGVVWVPDLVAGAPAPSPVVVSAPPT